MALERKDYDPDQPRDERGRFASTGGGAGATSSGTPLPEPHFDQVHSAVSQIPHTMGDPNADGSLAHPIYVDGDLDHAVREIYAGHHVRLDQPTQIATLVDKLGDMASDAVDKGSQAPTYDLGLVTVPGTNLFTQQSLGIPRVQMPQLSGVPLPGTPAEQIAGGPGQKVNLGDQFRDELEHTGFAVSDEKVAAETLRATQMDLVGPQVAGMADSLEQGKLNIRPIFVSKDNYVVDGHHQWAATVLANIRAGKHTFDIPVQRVDADIGTVLDAANEFTTAMGLPQKAGVAKTIAMVRKLLAGLERGPAAWVSDEGKQQALDQNGTWRTDGPVWQPPERPEPSAEEVDALGRAQWAQAIEKLPSDRGRKTIPDGLPKRIGDGRLLVPDDHFGQREIDRSDPDYYKFLRDIPQLRYFDLLVGGEDLTESAG